MKSSCPCPLLIILALTCFEFQVVCPFLHHVGPKGKFGLQMSVPNAFDTLASGLASICRLPKGVTISSEIIPKPEVRLLKLYDIENSRACRSVRECITEFDLVVEKVIPVAENSRATRDMDFGDSLPPGRKIPCLVASLPGGQEQTISGESEIINFFNDCVDVQENKEKESSLVEEAVEILLTAGSYTAGVLRSGRGCLVSPVVTASPRVKRPKEPLVLYSYEGNQFCRLVREVLTELDIVYELRSAGKGSPRRVELAKISGGSTQCPYLVDPNTGKSMPESADIVSYLYEEYALWTPPSELLEWASDSILANVTPIFGTLAPMQAGSRSLEADEYTAMIKRVLSEIETETNGSEAVVVYTYSWSPFSSETKNLLDRLKVEYKEISLGQEWIPGFIAPGGAEKRAALFQLTGQSSLPHIFVGGKSIGGLFSGTPGLIPSLREDKFLELVKEASKNGELA
jgi:glutaredoxin